MKKKTANKDKSVLEKIAIIVTIIAGIVGVYFLVRPKESNQDTLVGYQNSTDIEILDVEMKKYNGEEMIVSTFKNETDNPGLNFNVDFYNGGERIKKTKLLNDIIENEGAIKARQELSIPIVSYNEIKKLLREEYGSFELIKVDFDIELSIEKENKSVNELTKPLYIDYISHPFLLKCTYKDMFSKNKFVQKPVYFHIQLIKH